MLPRGTIEARHVWKRFRADRHRMLLRDELARLGARIRGDGDRGWRWALRDIDLEVGPGEAVGLIGTNGSGKTTLLKILARVMYPYAGRAEISGRVGALIEIRAGIHPDLTGRENIYVTGSVLGLRRKEVAKRFDEIVAFAEIEEAVDRQLKFYSSGMQMRLGFAIAAFLQPDVLLVDEVLAVGDSSFQQKCLDQMRAMLQDGTTLLFVSHDLAAVEATCRRGVWLRDSRTEADGEIRDIVSRYRRFVEEAAETAPRTEGVVRLSKAEAFAPEGGLARSQAPLQLTTVVESAEPRPAVLHIGISEGPATPIFVLRQTLHLGQGETEARCTIPRLPLPRGRFYAWVGLSDESGRDLLPWHPATHFDVMGPDLDPAPAAVVRLAPVHVESRWEVGRV